jgi:hypothetical protein
MIRVMTIALLLTIAAGVSHADSVPTLTVSPANLVGPAGSTVGWGFDVTNLGTDFAVITGSAFCTGAITSPCSNSLGTYTDFIGSQFFVVGPSPETNSVSQSFNNNAQTGFGSFLINLGATGSVTGELVMSYDLFSVDPNATNFDPTLDTTSVGNLLTTTASVAVGTKTVATPEPGSLVLLLGGLAGGLLIFKVRKMKFAMVPPAL